MSGQIKRLFYKVKHGFLAGRYFYLLNRDLNLECTSLGLDQKQAVIYFRTGYANHLRIMASDIDKSLGDNADSPSKRTVWAAQLRRDGGLAKDAKPSKLPADGRCRFCGFV